MLTLASVEDLSITWPNIDDEVKANICIAVSPVIDIYWNANA
jgi:hypothetical protein